jgi:hypothetical protein
MNVLILGTKARGDTMNRLTVAVLMLLIAGLFVVSCGDDDDPVTPGRRVTDLWIDSHYVLYPASPHYNAPAGGLAIIHEGSGAGPAVDNVTVMMNLDELTFDDTNKDYTGVCPGLVEGDNVTLTVVDGSSSMSETLNIPHAPMNLALSDGFWDISSVDATNTLMWDNPVDVGSSLVVIIYAFDGNSGPMLRYIEHDNVTATSVTIPNSDLSNFASVDTVVCAVWQKNLVLLDRQSDVSMFAAIAGVAGKWPTGQ